MKIDNLVKIEWANLLKTHVVCHTIYGDLTEPVVRLREKLRSPNLLSPIRAVFQDMLDFAEGKHENKQNLIEGIQSGTQILADPGEIGSTLAQKV